MRFANRRVRLLAAQLSVRPAFVLEVVPDIDLRTDDEVKEATQAALLYQARVERLATEAGIKGEKLERIVRVMVGVPLSTLDDDQVRMAVRAWAERIEVAGPDLVKAPWTPGEPVPLQLSRRIKQATAEFGLSERAIINRIRVCGWDEERALTTKRARAGKPRTGALHVVRGEAKTLRAWCEIAKISRQHVWRRMKQDKLASIAASIEVRLVEIGVLPPFAETETNDACDMQRAS